MYPPISCGFFSIDGFVYDDERCFDGLDLARSTSFPATLIHMAMEEIRLFPKRKGIKSHEKTGCKVDASFCMGNRKVVALNMLCSNLYVRKSRS